MKYQKNSVKNILYYLAKSKLEARRLSEILNDITGNKEKYKRVIEYISNNCFKVEPQIMNIKNGKGIKISEPVNLDLKDAKLIDKINKLSNKKLESIIKM